MSPLRSAPRFNKAFLIRFEEDMDSLLRREALARRVSVSFLVREALLGVYQNELQGPSTPPETTIDASEEQGHG